MTLATTADAIETDMLEHEHRRIRTGLVDLQEGIAAAHRLTRPESIDLIVRTLGWLRRDVLPHAAWEEAWLYPHLDETAGTPWATRALRFEHEQIRDLARALEAVFIAVEARWTSDEAYRLIVALTRIETLVGAHLAQEQWFVVPLLEHRGTAHVPTTEGAHR